MDQGEPLLEKVLHRLVKKYISGTTMNSALDKAKEINSRNIAASITFLSGNVVDKSKARYITTTYLELIRQISRLGIKASVQIPAEQIGFAIDDEAASGNLTEIINAGSKYGVFVWLEVHSPDYVRLNTIDESKRAFGLAFPHDNFQTYMKHYRGTKAVKLMFNEDKSASPKDYYYYRHVINDVRSMGNSVNNCILSYLPDKAFKSFVNNGIKKETSLAFEYGLGYSSKKLSKAVRRGARLSLLVPFGKDWVSYATTNVPEGYMRFFAKRLLNE